jgi:hypothetical protein
MFDILQWIVTALLLLFFLALEILDWQGRMELIESRWPLIWKAINNRPARLVLLFFCFAFLIRNFKDAVSIPPPPIVNFAAPIPPPLSNEKDVIITRQNEKIAELLRQIDDLTKKVKAKPPAVVDKKDNSEETIRLREVRGRLANLLSNAEAIKIWCLGVGQIPTGFSCDDAATKWYNETLGLIQRELEPQYKARFLAASGLALAYDRAKSGEINNLVNFLVFKENALNDFLKELSR